MPRLPIYNSQRSLTTDQPLPMKQGSAEEATAFAPVVEATAKMNQKWNEAVDSMQETSVKLGYEQTQAQIEANALNDTDINGEQKQLDILKKSGEESLKSVTNVNLRNQLKFQLDHANTMAEIKIKGIYAKKKIMADNLNTESLLNGYARSGDPENDNKAFSLIQSKVATGFYTPNQGEELLKKYRLGSVNFDIQSDPSTTQNESPILKELLKGKFGKYAKLTDDELSTKIKDAKINIWRNKNSKIKTDNENHTQGALDLSQRLVAQTLTSDDIENMARNGVIDAKTASLFENAIDPEKRKLTEDSSTMTADYLIQLLDKDKSSALDILREATELRTTKGLDDASYGFLLQEVNKKLEREKKGSLGLDKTTEVFKNSLKAIVDFATSMFSSPIKAGNEMTKKLVEKTQAGDDPSEAIKQIQKETVLTYHPAAVTYPDEGKKVIDSFGNIKIILPDGTIKDFAQTQKKAE